MLVKIKEAFDGDLGEVINKLINLIWMVCMTICAVVITYSFM